MKVDDEKEDSHQARNRAEKRLDLQAHSRHLVDRPQRSQNTEGPQSL